MKTYLIVYFGAAFMAAIFTPLIIFVARSLNIYDDLNARKVHVKAIPRLGGVAIFLAAMFMTIPVLLLSNTIGDAFRGTLKQVIGLLSAGTVIFLVGLIDDLSKLRARTKLLVQLIVAIGICSCVILIRRVGVEGWFSASFGWFAWPLTILWIVGITNAVNFIDCLDGLAAGISAIVCGVIAVFAIYTGQVVMAVLMLALLGSLTGFLFFNFNPAKIFMGDCGSMFLGFILAVASVMCSNKSMTLVALALPFLALGVPIFDMLFNMLRGFLERRSMFAPDRGHIHHRLLDMGLRHRHVVIFMYLVTLLAAGLGMFMMITRNANTVLVFGSVILMLLMIFRIVGTVRLRETIAQMKTNMQIKQQQKGYKREFEDSVLLMRNAQTFDSWWQSLCSAAKSMDITYLALALTSRDDTHRTLVWRNDNYQPNNPEEVNIVEMNLPLRQRRADQPLKIEVAVSANGSLESTGHRLALFIRLIDEYSLAHLPQTTQEVRRVETLRRGKMIPSFQPIQLDPKVGGAKI